MNMGTVVAGGRTYAITSLALLDGGLKVWAEGLGPAPALDGEPVTIFGADGRGFAQGGRLTAEAAGPGDRVRFWVILRFTKIIDD